MLGTSVDLCCNLDWWQPSSQDQLKKNALHFVFPKPRWTKTACQSTRRSISIAHAQTHLIDAFRRDLGTQVVSDIGDKTYVCFNASPNRTATHARWDRAWPSRSRPRSVRTPTEGPRSRSPPVVDLKSAAVGTSASGKRHQKQQSLDNIRRHIRGLTSDLAARDRSSNSRAITTHKMIMTMRGHTLLSLDWKSETTKSWLSSRMGASFEAGE